MPQKVARRGFLAWGAGAMLAGTALAACSGGAAQPTASTSSSATKSTAPSTSPTAPSTSPTAPSTSSTASTSSATAAPAQSSGSAQQITLREARFPGVGWEQDPKYTAIFEQAHPNIKVTGEDTPYGQMYKKVLTQGATGTLADIFPGHTRWVSYWEYKGLCLELMPLVKTYADETKFDDFFPSIIKDMQGNPGANGKLYTFPTIVHPGGNAVVELNLDLIEKAGVKLPTQAQMDTSDWTVKDLEAIIRGAGKPKGNIWGASITYSSPLYSTQVTRSWSDSSTEASPNSWVLSPDGKKDQLGSPNVKQSFEWYHQLVVDGFVPTSLVQTPGQGLDFFTAGQEVAKTNIIAVQADGKKIGDKFKWTTLLWPKGANGYRGSCLSYNTWSLYSKTKYPDDTFHLLNTLTGTDCGFWAGYDGNAVPYCRHSIWFDQRNWTKYPIYKQGASWFQQGIDPFPMPWNLRAQEYQDSFMQNTQKYLDGKQDWSQMYTPTHDAVQKILDEPRP